MNIANSRKKSDHSTTLSVSCIVVFDVAESICIQYGQLNEAFIYMFQSLPEFVYKSSDCAYVFNWDTDIVCENPDM